MSSNFVLQQYKNAISSDDPEGVWLEEDVVTPGNDIRILTELAAKLDVPQRCLAVCMQTRQFIVMSKMFGSYLPGCFPVVGGTSMWTSHCFCCDDILTDSKAFLPDDEDRCRMCHPDPTLGFCKRCVDSNICFLCRSSLEDWKPADRREELLNSSWNDPEKIDSQPASRSAFVRLARIHPCEASDADVFCTLVRD